METVQKVSAVDASQIRGINISGYKYSDKFIAFALLGAGIGIYFAHYFKQKPIGYFALASAGMLGFSSIALKVFPPVRAARN